MNSEQKSCQNCKNQFVVEAGDFDFYKKIEVPLPTFCPDCRLERRLAFQNQRALYKRGCDLCRQETISMYPADAPFPVYCMKCYESDAWEGATYGVDYDFSRNFFEQFKALQERVPHKALMGQHSTWNNSPYNNMAHELKNCYLLFNSDMNENCSYSSELERSQNSLDLLMADSCQFCYSCVGCMNSYQCFFSVGLESCSDVWFSRNMVGCSDCFGCVNLKNQKYCIFNEQYSKEEYRAKVDSLWDGTFSNLEKIQKDVEAFYLRHPRRFMYGTHNADVSGDYIYNSKNVKNSYIVYGGQDCRYCMWLIIKPNKDCYDYSQFGQNATRVYEAITSGQDASDLKFCKFCVTSVARLSYCEDCYDGCSDLFGCAGLKKKQYCILNKQYSKEEYGALVPRIIAHMKESPYVDAKGRSYGYGEFFPVELSPHAYNETDAQEFFPKSKEDIIAAGYRWAELEDKKHVPTLSWKDLPARPAEADDALTKKIILCKAWEEDQAEAIRHRCSKAYRLLAEELAFYKRFNIPLPRYCPNSRHNFRMRKRNPLKFWRGGCQCEGGSSKNDIYRNTAQHFHGNASCPIQFETSYGPERGEIIYCEQCYQAEVA